MPVRLAVATHDPDTVAETYVRQHMRRILPGRTVGLGLNAATTVSGRCRSSA